MTVTTQDGKVTINELNIDECIMLAQALEGKTICKDDRMTVLSKELINAALIADNTTEAVTL